VNSNWFGDSYDIVKRFFVETLRSCGYLVYIDPMPTGDWTAIEPRFLKFLGAQHVRDALTIGESALFVDPDTGIAAVTSRKHTSIAKIVNYLQRHTIVFVFDQSFSRNAAPLAQLHEKLRQVQGLGAHGFYYDSHARFLFMSNSSPKLLAFRDALLNTGLPAHRLVEMDLHAVQQAAGARATSASGLPQAPQEHRSRSVVKKEGQ
jgi:hypothetical protein